MVKGLRLKVVLQLMKVHILLIVLGYTKSWRKTKSIISKIKTKVKQYRGPHLVNKVAYVNGKYFWDMYGVGWPTLLFKQNVINECKRIEKGNEKPGLRNVLFGITTKCPLQCEHCYEWQNLNIKERLSFNDLSGIVEKLIAHGVGQIHLGGGEPMMRYNEILKLLQRYSNQAGFWIVTSGYGFSREHATQLKLAGLTGVCVSLDHHNENLHNQFRNHTEAFAMAEKAAKVCKSAGLVTSLSLCSTKEFTSDENLKTYAELSKNWGVSFIQLLEPRAVGHYEGKSVKLSLYQKEMLERFFLTLNNDVNHSNYPIVIYHEYYKPTLGCRGAGNGALYIDPLGNVHPCPFCRKFSGNLVRDSLDYCLSVLYESGCLVQEQPNHSNGTTPKILLEKTF